MSKWRYQPVIVEGTFALIVIQIDDDGKLETWDRIEDQTCFAEVIGPSVEELRATTIRQMRAAHEWKPVKYKYMQAGMTFQREDV